MDGWLVPGTPALPPDHPTTVEDARVTPGDVKPCGQETKVWLGTAAKPLPRHKNPATHTSPETHLQLRHTAICTVQLALHHLTARSCPNTKQAPQQQGSSPPVWLFLSSV
jgi:hypothetical protein